MDSLTPDRFLETEFTGDGYGSGDGNLKNIRLKKNVGEVPYMVDGIPCIFVAICKNVARVRAVRSDFSLVNAYIVKDEEHGIFAHGETFEEARAALREKIIESMDTDEKIDKFLNTFNLSDKYPAREFYEWHHLLTGSCEFGRNEFVAAHGIDLDNDTYTVREFLTMCQNDYGGEIIRRILERIEEEYE